MRRIRVVLFPGITGEDRLFVETMALALPDDETETIRYPGIVARSAHLMDLAIAAETIAARMTFAPAEPVVFIGYSYGGNLAYEVAHRVIARGARLERLILIDPALPNTAFRLRGNEPARDLPHGPIPSSLYAWRPVRIALFLMGFLLPERLRKKLTRRILYDLRVHARRTWTPSPIAAQTLHIVSEQLAPVVSVGWMQLCLLIRQVEVADSHIDILRLPRRTDVARAIRMELDEVTRDCFATQLRFDSAGL